MQNKPSVFCVANFNEAFLSNLIVLYSYWILFIWKTKPKPHLILLADYRFFWVEFLTMPSFIGLLNKVEKKINFEIRNTITNAFLRYQIYKFNTFIRNDMETSKAVDGSLTNWVKKAIFIWCIIFLKFVFRRKSKNQQIVVQHGGTQLMMWASQKK